MKDDAADLTKNDDAVETSNTKNKETIIFYEELHLYILSYIWSPGVSDILENFSCGTEYLCMGYQISQEILHGVPRNFAWGTEYPRKFCMGY